MFTIIFLFVGIIGMINAKYDGKVPSIDIIESRKCLAKFIGLTLFKLGRECLAQFGPNFSINGPCCGIHRLEGLKEAHDLFPKLFEPFGVKFEKIDAVSDTFFTSLLAVYADFKTQIIVSEMILILRNNESTSLSHRLEDLLETYFGSALHIPYLKGKLQDRAVQIRGILERGGSNVNLSECLNSKYPVDLFESNLKNVLRNVYSAFPETFLNELIRLKDDKTIKEKENILKSKQDMQPPFEGLKQAKSPLKAPQAMKEEDSPFKDVIISGKFFRGILEPVDERFAAIIEGRDFNVRQYLEYRKKHHPTEQQVTSKSSLMERHNSAEKISWETQEQEENTPEIGFNHNNSIYTDEIDPEDYQNGTRKFPMATVKRSSDGPRGRRRFSEQEVMNLIEGIRRFGRDWRRILSNYNFNDRSNVDLKDKARNLEKLGLI